MTGPFKYSWLCPRCGFYFESEVKGLVAMERKKHRAKKSYTIHRPDGVAVLNGNHSCGLTRLSDGTAARPALKPHLAQ